MGIRLGLHPPTEKTPGLEDPRRSYIGTVRHPSDLVRRTDNGEDTSVVVEVNRTTDLVRGVDGRDNRWSKDLIYHPSSRSPSSPKTETCTKIKLDCLTVEGLQEG